MKSGRTAIVALGAAWACGAPALAANDNEAAAFAAARAANDLCAPAKRNGVSLADAARRAGLRPTEPGLALPGHAAGSPVWRVPSLDGHVFLYESATGKNDCFIAIAYSPAEGADMAADMLAKAGMRKGQAGRIGQGGRYQQLSSPDGRVWVNAVAYETVAGKPAPAITTALQVGAN